MRWLRIVDGVECRMLWVESKSSDEGKELYSSIQFMSTGVLLYYPDRQRQVAIRYQARSFIINPCTLKRLGFRTEKVALFVQLRHICTSFILTGIEGGTKHLTVCWNMPYRSRCCDPCSVHDVKLYIKTSHSLLSMNNSRSSYKHHNYLSSY